MIAKSHRWQITAVAVAALAGLWSTQTLALSLGRVAVQSSLGEALKAEIEILDINAEEAATLSARIAPPESFKAAGLDFNPAMSGLRVTLSRRTNGLAYLQLSSDRPVNDPFIDMILEASWSTGRIVRDYTMLFDPPNLRPAPTTAAQVPQANPAPAPETVVRSQAPTVAAAPAATARSQAQATPAKPAKPVVSAKPASAVPVARSTSIQTPQVTIKPGDTAGRIAQNHKLPDVSLDQMLVAMLRANPDAFIGDNINRIKSGTVVTLPSSEQASATPDAQAKQIIAAQSQDFNAFRRQLASSVPTVPSQAPGREARGKIEASVKDSKPQPASPDKLTLSKGSVSALAADDQLAQAKNAQAASARKDELAKNIQQLNKLAGSTQASAATAATAPTPAASQAVLPLTSATASALQAPAGAASASAAAVAAAAPASQPSLAASAQPAASASAAVAPAASAPAPSAPQLAASKPVPPAPEPAAEPSVMDNLITDPLLPLGAAAVLALLAGLGVYKVRQRKKTAAMDSSFLESRLNPESFFGASGGQNVDTHDSPVTGSSMIYSPSQLDAVDDVDPVAEADVYLAYGRDLQAEEILKDALRSNPNRLAIHQKLLDIYAKRQDTKAFEAIATLAFNLTDGHGTDWEQVCEKGMAIDPDNVLYLPGGQPQTPPSAATQPMALGVDAAANDVVPDMSQLGSDLDLDLDFSLDEPLPESSATLSLPDTAPEPVSVSMPEPEPEPAVEPVAASNTIDFSFDPLPTLAAEPTETAADTAPLSEPLPTLADETPDALPDLDFSLPESAAPQKSDEGLLEFDLGSLSLDLDDDPITESGALPNGHEDPLETKLALAEEFKAIGDDDGARALIEEVIAEAAGDIKSKAQRALKQL